MGKGKKKGGKSNEGNSKGEPVKELEKQMQQTSIQKQKPASEGQAGASNIQAPQSQPQVSAQPSQPHGQRQEGPRQQGPSGPRQQGPPGPRHQGPTGTRQQAPGQQWPQGPRQQGQSGPGQQTPPGSGQQWPPGPRQQGPPGPGQQGPTGPGQQGQSGPGQKGPPGSGQQWPPGPRQQGPPGPRQQGPPGPRQQGPPGPRQQGPPGPRQQGPPGPRQQGPPGPRQQGPSVPPQSTPPKQAQVGGRDATSSGQPLSSGDRRLQETQKSITECKFKIPLKKPGNSVRCTQRKIITNYMPLNITALKVFRYDVIFTPQNPKKWYWNAMQSFMQKNFPNHLIAFDRVKNFYSVKQLKGVTMTEERFADKVVLQDNVGKEVKFEISIKFTGVIDLDQLNVYMKSGTSLNPPTEAIHCLDVVLRQGRLSEMVKAGRSFFSRPNRPLDLGDGLEMWTGLFQSAIFTSRPYLNVDVAHKGFPKTQSIMSLVEEFRLDTRTPIDKQNRWALESLESFLKGLKILACIGGQSNNKREYICNGLSKSADQQKFTLTDANGRKENMSVAEYFEREKKMRLRYPWQNCLWVGPRDKNIHFPMELCEVSPGQVVNKQLNEFQLSKMVREAATKPDIRFAKIKEMMQKANYANNAHYREFGLSVSEDFASVDGKILDPPAIQYSENRPTIPMKGVWRPAKFARAGVLEKWAIVGVECDQRGCNTDELIRQFQNEGKKMGLHVAQVSKQNYGIRVQNLHAVLQECARENMQLIVLVMGSRCKEAYSQIKKVAETQVGALTQCIKQKTMERFSPSTASNLLLKINSKLSGLNQVLANKPPCLTGLVMVVGADVTHPSPDQQNIPSIAAVTASIDPHCYQYNVCLSIQSPKQEMIQQFKEMLMEHLSVFKSRAKNNLPKKVYIFRDGVSEGQFAQVLQYELTAVHEAFRAMGAQTQPEVLFLLVQKRHHTRFFLGPKDPNNVEPGTVVDKSIVHANELDFYLVSHAAIKGTARPTRYHCIRNDISLADDEVQQLTYYLCHLYARCTRAVSYPAPTYYAHLACLRARALTFGLKYINADLERKPIRLTVLEEFIRKNPMFYI